jgi:hypothetical protein
VTPGKKGNKLKMTIKNRKRKMSMKKKSIKENFLKIARKTQLLSCGFWTAHNQ